MSLSQCSSTKRAALAVVWNSSFDAKALSFCGFQHVFLCRNGQTPANNCLPGHKPIMAKNWSFPSRVLYVNISRLLTVLYVNISAHLSLMLTFGVHKFLFSDGWQPCPTALPPAPARPCLTPLGWIVSIAAAAAVASGVILLAQVS